MIRRLALLVVLSSLVAGVALTQKTTGHQGQSTTTHKTGKSHKDSMSSTTQGSMKLDSDDQKFVMKAAEGGKAEVELGQLAQSKASRDEVKKFAQRMIDDHGKANGELMQLAQSKGIQLPMTDATSALNTTDPDMARMNTSTTTPHKADMDHDKMMKSEEQKLMGKLSKLSGADFDREYMKHMVEDHVKDVAMFEKEAKSGKDAELKAWAEKTLPTLKEHLQMAREVNAKVDGKATARKTNAMK